MKKNVFKELYHKIYNKKNRKNIKLLKKIFNFFNCFLSTKFEKFANDQMIIGRDDRESRTSSGALHYEAVMRFPPLRAKPLKNKGTVCRSFMLHKTCSFRHMYAFCDRVTVNNGTRTARGFNRDAYTRGRFT